MLEKAIARITHFPKHYQLLIQDLCRLSGQTFLRRKRLFLGLTIALLPVRAIANAVALIGQEFSQLVYIFEFLIETHPSNRYADILHQYK